MVREEEISRIRDLVEPMVWPLVEAILRETQVLTIESCEGHLPHIWKAPDGTRHLVKRSPFVLMEYPPAPVAAVLAHSIACPRFRTHFDWHLRLGEHYSKPCVWLEPEITPENETDLAFLWDDIDTLARSLKEHFQAFRENRFAEMVDECVETLIK